MKSIVLLIVFSVGLLCNGQVQPVNKKASKEVKQLLTYIDKFR